MAKAKRQFRFGGLTSIRKTDLVMSQLIGIVSAEEKKLLGMVIDFTSKLRSGAISIEEAEAFLNRRNPFGQNAKSAKPNLLQYVDKFFHGGRVGKFVAKNCFKKLNLNGVKFSGFGSNFTSNFLEKVEDTVPAGELKAHKLLRGSRNRTIIIALGDSHETYLGDLYILLAGQPQGENGLLLTNGYANIFFIRDANRKLWTVNANWYGGGWGVFARSIGDPFVWGAGFQVFSR